MKTYVLIISPHFPKYHIRAFERTMLREKIRNQTKLHTLRKKYWLWKERFDEIEKGNACLSVRRWTGLPYRSKQEELFRFTKEDCIGLEKLDTPDNFVFALIGEKHYKWEDVALRDGLSWNDFNSWFRKMPSEPMAIIHFTSFRYTQSNLGVTNWLEGE